MMGSAIQTCIINESNSDNNMIIPIFESYITNNFTTETQEYEEEVEPEAEPELQEEVEPEAKLEEEHKLSEKTISTITCPISLEIMEDPITTQYGDTFDKKSLLTWLEKNKDCPLSRRPINIDYLIPNKALKMCIEHYRSMNLLPENKKYEETKKEQTKKEENNNVSNYSLQYLPPLDYPLNPDFTFIDSEHTRDIIESAYNTICNMNEWDFMRRYKPSNETGYMCDRNPRVVNIICKIDENFQGHSGSSLMITMRCIQKIAIIGFEEFKRTY